MVVAAEGFGEDLRGHEEIEFRHNLDRNITLAPPDLISNLLSGLLCELFDQLCPCGIAGGD
jgi:hypothetical protein